MIKWLFGYYAFVVKMEDGRERYVCAPMHHTGESPTSLVDNKRGCIGYGAFVTKGYVWSLFFKDRIQNNGFNVIRMVRCHPSKCPSLFEQYLLTER